eukprot:149726-Pyramimonas_sp.AAC.1
MCIRDSPCSAPSPCPCPSGWRLRPSPPRLAPSPCSQRRRQVPDVHRSWFAVVRRGGPRCGVSCGVLERLP